MPFANTPPLLGTVELQEHDERSAVAVVHGFVQNQGDAWTVTGAYLDRFIEEQRLLAAETAGHSDEQVAYVRRMEQVGKRVAEMQLALASRGDLADFARSRSPRRARRWSKGLVQRPCVLGN